VQSLPTGLQTGLLTPQITDVTTQNPLCWFLWQAHDHCIATSGPVWSNPTSQASAAIVHGPSCSPKDVTEAVLAACSDCISELTVTGCMGSNTSLPHDIVTAVTTSTTDNPNICKRRVLIFTLPLLSEICDLTNVGRSQEHLPRQRPCQVRSSPRAVRRDTLHLSPSAGCAQRCAQAHRISARRHPPPPDERSKNSSESLSQACAVRLPARGEAGARAASSVPVGRVSRLRTAGIVSVRSGPNRMFLRVLSARFVNF